VRSADPTKSIENHQDARFDKLEALIEKGLADVRADLKETRGQLGMKDAQIAALLERVRESNAITMRAVNSEK
jgi:hypothetical protein